MSLIWKIFEILSARQRWRMLRMFGLMLIGMVMETVGIGLIVPLASLLSGGDGTGSLPDWARNLRSLIKTDQDGVVWGMLALVLVFAIKALFLGFLAWRQVDFVFGTRAEISQRLFSGYLRADYPFHLSRNSAQLLRNVGTEVDQFAKGSLSSALVLATEALVVIGIGALLLLVEPVGALAVILVLGLAGGSFTAITRARLQRWGKARQYHERFRIQHVQQALGGVKDVKLLGREQHFLDQYAIHNTGGARIAKRQTFLQTIPRIWLELVAVAGFAALVLSMSAQGRPDAAFVPTLGLFAGAAFRIIPSVNRLLAAIQQLRFTTPVVNLLHEEVTRFEGRQPTSAGEKVPIMFDSCVELRNVSYEYPDGTRAVADVHLVIPLGATIGFIGTSGAGKSTLVDLIMGLLRPTQGAVLVDGQDITLDLRSWQDQIGYVPQSIFLTDDTLRRNVAFGLPSDEINDDLVRAALRAAHMEEFLKTLSNGLDTMVGERGVRLSGGQRQRIGIARALYHNPRVLVLDEATSALDTATESKVMEAIAALRGKTIIIIAHRLSTVANCDTVIRLENGRVAELSARTHSDSEIRGSWSRKSREA